MFIELITETPERIAVATGVAVIAVLLMAAGVFASMRSALGPRERGFVRNTAIAVFAAVVLLAAFYLVLPAGYLFLIQILWPLAFLAPLPWVITQIQRKREEDSGGSRDELGE